MVAEVSVEASALGPVVRPREHDETVILYLHGNEDFSIGPESVLNQARELALLIGSPVVCARYRNSFPAALEDVRAAYHHCQNTGPVAIAGERMGGGLAAALLVHLRDTGAAPPYCAILVSALLDLTMQARSLFLNARADPSFDVIALRQRVADYAGGAPLTDSRVNPLYANLHGLPPVQLLAAGTDPQLDDSLSFAARAAHDRVPIDLRIWPDAAGQRAATVAAMAGFTTAWHAATSTRTADLLSG